jgi:hypothetical protein
MTRTRRLGIPILLLGFITACGAEPPEGESGPERDGVAPFASVEQTAFWGALQAMCGEAYRGTLVENEPPSADFEGQVLVMHVRECSDDEIRVPFFVGDDRSRTWVFTPSKDGRAMRLEHDHRHEDGSEDEVTRYGGDTEDPGTATRQSFPADAFTAEMVPAAATNVWTVELIPGALFAYQLRREGTDRRFRVEFDLTRPTDAPPAPWGANQP